MTKRKKSKSKGNKLDVNTLRSKILGLFQTNPKKRFNPKQVIRKLKIKNNKDSVLDAIMKLVEKGKLIQLEDYKFKVNRSKGFGAKSNDRDRQLLVGRVDMARSGDAYIVIENVEDDVHVSSKYLASALNGDTVEIKTWRPRGRRKLEGEVTRVIKRSATHFLGTLHDTKDFGFVIPANTRMNTDIIVYKDDFKGAVHGDTVVVKIIKWEGKKLPNPVGVVTEIMTDSNRNDLEMTGILLGKGISIEFPEHVMKEAEDLSTEIPLMEIERRKDMREITTFTIDPVDAKDFDDALSIEYFEDGTYEIGVHIADVSHYVKPRSALDKEAVKRANSVYLVDRVIPMLPEKLSNALCSLRPHEDKLTFSANFRFSKDDKIVGRWFGKTIIHSDHRFTYEAAQEVLDEKEGPFFKELKKINKLSKKLRKQRFKRGSIDFGAAEVRFKLDEEGAPIEVYVKERKDTNMLIEEFMLLANREVATFIDKKAAGKEIPFPYRVHDLPDMDRVAELVRFAKELGYQMNINTPEEVAVAFNKMTEQSKEDEILKMLEPIAIRTMSKAEYSSNNLGHYGLGFEFYAHFTSPIRRYADVLVHRILEANLEGTYRMDKEVLESTCKHISLQERKAMEAERESTKYKQAEFMGKHVGETFDGVVSGIIERGVFIELVHSKSEGMIGFDKFPEPYEVADNRLSASGRRSGEIIRMGDKVEVKILSVDMAKRQIDMEFVMD